MADNTIDMSYLLDVKPSAEDLAIDHAMDISAAVYHRLNELEMSQSDLAKALGVDRSWVSRIIHGYPGMTLKTLAKLELALDFDLGSGFVYRPHVTIEETITTIRLNYRRTSEPAKVTPTNSIPSNTCFDIEKVAA